MFKKTPLAWLQLSHQKIRLLVAILGVAFANILIFTQLGLRLLLFDGAVLMPSYLNGDLYLLSAYSESIQRSSFPFFYLYRADAVEGVASTSPLYMDYSQWVDPKYLGDSSENKRGYYVPVLAFNPTQPVFDIPEVNANLDVLSSPDSVLFDRLGQTQLGDIATIFAKENRVDTIMNNQRVRVVGLFDMGSTMSDKGHIIMSDWNFGRRKGNERLEKVTLGVVKLEPSAAIGNVKQSLQNNLGKDIRVLTKEELIQAEQDFIAQFPEGKILNFGAMMGFIVGIVIVYQVLFTDISEHLPEYATLKAMGYNNRKLLIVVLQEAMILAVMGFIPGFLASYWVYGILEDSTKIPLEMNPAITWQVFILTIAMCGISGAIAVNKLRAADPADIFH